MINRNRTQTPTSQHQIDRIIDGQAIQIINNRAIYTSKTEPDKAIREYTQATKIDSDNPVLYLNRGVAKLKNNAFGRAISDFNKALELDPEHALAYYNRGLALAETGRIDDAITDYTRAIQYAPELEAAYNNRGIARSDNGNNVRAIADFNTAIKIEPDFAAAYFNRAKALSAIGRIKTAVDDFVRGLQLDPKLIRPHSKLIDDILEKIISDRRDDTYKIDTTKQGLTAGKLLRFTKKVRKKFKEMALLDPGIDSVST